MHLPASFLFTLYAAQEAMAKSKKRIQILKKILSLYFNDGSNLSQCGVGGNDVLKQSVTNTNGIQGRMPSNLLF
jgi:hypothetical protein